MSTTRKPFCTIGNEVPNNYGIIMEYCNRAAGRKSIKHLHIYLDNEVRRKAKHLFIEIIKYAKYNNNVKEDDSLRRSIFNTLLSYKAKQAAKQEGNCSVINFMSHYNRLFCEIRDFRNNVVR